MLFVLLFCNYNQDVTYSVGVNCSSKGEEDSAGQGKSDTLLNEPIWIGMIVVLSLAFAFTSMFVVRRSCEKNLKCCSGQEKGNDNIVSCKINFRR